MSRHALKGALGVPHAAQGGLVLLVAASMLLIVGKSIGASFLMLDHVLILMITQLTVRAIVTRTIIARCVTIFTAR